MQTINLHDTKTSTYSNESGSYIEGFLIGTKKNKNGWQINKNSKNIGEQVGQFINKPFIIIPEKIAHGIDAHYHGKTKEDTIKGYNDYSHGVIEGILGPHSYNDGTDDFYYTHVTKLNNSKSAAVLQQYGSLAKVPFATSPHIWQEDEIATDIVDNFTAIGIALVDEGAYGDISVINKICNGPKDSCHRSLGASNNHCGCCENSDENVAKILSSHFSKSANLESKLSTNQSNPQNGTQILTNPPTFTDSNNATVNPQNALTNNKEPQKDPNQITLTKEQYDTFLKNEAESKQTKKQLDELINEKKLDTLNSIFTAESVQDENIRNSLIEKYKSYDNKFVKEFYADITKNVLPSLLEKAKQTAKEETANEIKSKSKGASILRPEPRIVTEEENENKSKSASVKTRDEIALLRKYMFGAF